MTAKTYGLMNKVKRLDNLQIKLLKQAKYAIKESAITIYNIKTQMQFVLNLKKKHFVSDWQLNERDQVAGALFHLARQ